MKLAEEALDRGHEAAPDLRGGRAAARAGRALLDLARGEAQEGLERAQVRVHGQGRAGKQVDAARAVVQEEGVPAAGGGGGGRLGVWEGRLRGGEKQERGRERLKRGGGGGGEDANQKKGAAS